MADIATVQVRFQKGYFKCPSCGQEDIVDFNVEGGNNYEHACSNCSTLNNSFKKFSSRLVYPLSVYETKTEQDLADDKDAMISSWIYDIKNPVIPVVIEKLITDYKEEHIEYFTRLAQLLDEMIDKYGYTEFEDAKEKLVDANSDIMDKFDEVIA